MVLPFSQDSRPVLNDTQRPEVPKLLQGYPMANLTLFNNNFQLK